MIVTVRDGCYAAPVQVGPKQRVFAQLLSAVLLVAVSAAYVAFLLAQFPYDGLFGQDSYGYFGQARAWWREIAAESDPAFAFYSSQEFRWPVGYHLHVIAGFLLGGVGTWGGWALNVLMTVLTPLLVYLLVGSLWAAAPARARIVSGLVAGGLLLLSGTFVRYGLSLMADVPALFWGLVGYVCLLKAWPMRTEVKRQEAGGSRFGEKDGSWGSALGGGVALGLAVLTRYGAALLIPPLVVYLLLRWWQSRNSSEVSAMPRHIGWAVLGFAVGLLPQGFYLLTHESGAGYSAFLGDWSLGNLFARTVTSADGAITYDYPMLAFFLVIPFVSADAGFMHFLSFPAYLVGMATLAQRRAWPVFGLLITWWLVPSLVLSGTPYQAHRFVIMYLPALVIPVGIGVAVAVEALLGALRDPAGTRKPLTALAAVALLLVVSIGALYEWQGTRNWMAAHVAFKEEERGVLELARRAFPPGEEPRVVAFGMTAAIYHYTGWPALDLYNHDQVALGRFLDGQGTRLLAVPEPQLEKQWAATPTGERWRWLRDTYSLELRGKAGQYSVYRVKEP